jgi:hypothetical protein
MNKSDRVAIKAAATSILHMWKESITPDHWYKNEYKQGLRDALQAMKLKGLIADYSLDHGITMPIHK